MGRLKGLLLGALAAVAVAAPASSGTLDIYVGYADGIRGALFSPSPFCGGATFTDGNCIGGYTGYDTGAIWVRNNTGASVTLTGLNVQDSIAKNFAIWTFPITLANGESAMFFENAGNNFDSSDFSNAAGTGIGGTGSAAGDCNHSNGYFPTINLSFGGSNHALSDSAQVLNTGGFDFACIGNENLGWRLLGTTGIGVRGNQIPEPATLSFIGAGLAGAAALRRRRKAIKTAS